MDIPVNSLHIFHFRVMENISFWFLPFLSLESINTEKRNGMCMMMRYVNVGERKKATERPDVKVSG